MHSLFILQVRSKYLRTLAYFLAAWLNKFILGRKQSCYCDLFHINLKTRLRKRTIYINPCYVEGIQEKGNKIIKKVLKKVKNDLLKTRCRSQVRYSAILFCKMLYRVII
jgi:hypothetical protein